MQGAGLGGQVGLGLPRGGVGLLALWPIHVRLARYLLSQRWHMAMGRSQCSVVGRMEYTTMA